MTRTIDRIGPGADWEQAVYALASTNLARKQARGEDGTIESSRAFAERRLAPAFEAIAHGHTVTWDPPAGLTSVQTRWSCVDCGRAVLQRTSMDHTYGSALDGQCPGRDGDR